MTVEDLWHVKLPSGDILTVTLDQLDGAFADGHVNESTLVRQAGTPEWSTLGAIAGLDEAVPVAAAPPPRARSASSAPRVDPFVVPTPAYPIAPSSMAPMAFDLDDELAFATKKKPIGVVLAVCGACAFLILAAVGLGSADAPAVAAVAAAAQNAKTETHLSAPPQAPVQATVEPVKVAEPIAPQLTEAQKKAVQAADKKLKQKAGRKAAPAKKPAKDPFVKGGSKHDPLNKSL
jgi:hypothetical protein